VSEPEVTQTGRTSGAGRRDRSAERHLHHGTVTCYMYAKCNCHLCKAAWAQRTQDLKALRRQQLADGTAQVDHGKVTTYINWGCRCPACTGAWRTRAVNRRAKSRKASGSAAETA
jgi:hypothetical protein